MLSRAQPGEPLVSRRTRQASVVGAVAARDARADLAVASLWNIGIPLHRWHDHRCDAARRFHGADARPVFALALVLARPSCCPLARAHLVPELFVSRMGTVGGKASPASRDGGDDI